MPNQPTYEELEAQNKEFIALIRHHQEKNDWHQDHAPIGRMAEAVMRHYEEERTGAVAAHKHLIEDLLIYMRAFALVLEMVGNAGTHREKDARLRGAVEMVESTIQKLRDEQFSTTSLWWRSIPDIFRSDYPVREYKQAIFELEEKLKKLTGGQDGTATTMTPNSTEFTDWP